MNDGTEKELARLMRAAIAGDEKAYGEFLRRTASLVRRFAERRIVQGGIDPEDVVQEALLALHSKRHTWRPDARILPWIYAIARYKLVDALRSRGRRLEIDVDAIADSFAQPEAERLSNREIERALETLAPGQRSVVAAVSIHGSSISEAAEKLGMSQAAVRVALHRGLAAIGKRFGKAEDGHE